MSKDKSSGGLHKKNVKSALNKVGIESGIRDEPNSALIRKNANPQGQDIADNKSVNKKKTFGSEEEKQSVNSILT